MDVALIYCQHASSRLAYITGEIGKRIGISFRTTLSKGEFDAHPGPKISYGEAYPEGGIHIPEHGLLWETGIRSMAINVQPDPAWGKIFFEAGAPAGIPFDLFAASFFLLSRYEEYWPHKTDHHERYAHQQSVAFINGFLEIPLVDQWCMELKYLLLKKWPAAVLEEKRYRYLSTIDIDFAYKYQGIGLKRQVLKCGRSIVQLRWKDAVEQLMVVTGSKKDPYDTYDLIHTSAERNRVDLHYFVLMKTGTQYDKNIFPTGLLMQQLIKKLGKRFAIGLHPSYDAHNEQALQEEKALLEQCSTHQVTHTRQHFLRFTLPGTYRLLAQLGFTDDYSMAYSLACGFRASTSWPFRFFDLGTNEATALTIHPTAVMDVTLKNQDRLTPDQAVQKISRLVSEVRKVNGTLISIWHNSNLCEDKEWKEWRAVLEKMHTLASVKTKNNLD